MLIICHVASLEHMFKVLSEFRIEAPKVNYHLVLFGGHWFSASGDIKYLICHMISKSHVVEGSCNLMSEPLIACYHPVKFGGHGPGSSKYVFNFSW